MTQTLDEHEPLTLDEACVAIFKNAIRPGTLRAEAERGNLVIERIGRRDFVTRAAIREMRKKCEVVRSEKAPAFGFSQDGSATLQPRPQSGSSETARLSVARDAALLTVEALSRPSRATLRKSTSPPSETVIPLRS